MKLSKKLEKFSHLQLLFGFSLFYVFCLYDNVSGVLYPVFLTGMLMMYQCLMEQAAPEKSLSGARSSLAGRWRSC